MLSFLKPFLLYIKKNIYTYMMLLNCSVSADGMYSHQLETFSVYNAWSGLVIFFLRNPHLLKG